MLLLSRGNFYDEKEHSNKVLQFGAESPVFVPHRVYNNLRSLKLRS